AIITLSAHMPNFELIDQRVKNFEVSGGTTNETLGYWIADDGSKQYNFSGYTPGTTSGNIVSRIMPGQDLNYLYTDYLDLIADYAKAVEGDGITILFRPLHENTGSWFWWGAAFCDEQAYINLYRYTVDYLKETKDVHNIIYVYGPGSEAANVSEYSARYPGDAYVDMIGYDLYHQNPSQENEAGYLQSIKKQNTILRDFATAHKKLYAITETGVADKDAAGGDIALQRTGNKVMDWYMQLLDEISDDGVSYFLVWANFSENGSFYLPYAVEKKEDGYLHGHEMMDEFINFYNDGRSVFATDMNSEFKKVSGVTNTTQPSDVSGYFIAPQSGDRILPDENNPKTRIAAKVSGVDPEAEDLSVQFVVATEFDEVVLRATYNEKETVWEAELKDSALVGMGEAMGTITLIVNDKKISEITARFNMVEAVQNDMVPEDFEGYNGNSQQLGLTWATNKASGSEINLSLTNDSEKVFGGEYGLQMDITLAAADAWAGATKSFNADWSAGNALEFYTIPETNGQKIVVQVTAGNQVFEVYLQEFDSYTTNAADGFPVKVTIPFSAFVGRDSKDAKLDPSKIESIGLWCNAIAKEGVEFPLSTTLYYDEFKVVTTDKTAVDFAPTAYKGIWFKEIPAQTYTGKAIKPDVQVYDDAKLLTPKKDYTVSYKNNTKAGEADVIIKGKGNYNETITGHFRILEKEIGELTITAPEYIIYNGKEQNIAVTVKDGKKKLGTKNDYTQEITFDDGSEQAAVVQKAKEEGTYKIKITMKGNYTGETELTCKVVKDKDLLSKATVTLPAKSLDYDDGKEVMFDESKIVVKLKGKVIPKTEENGTVNYVVSYENNKQVGTASVVITAGTDSKYVGSVRKTFTIKGKTFSTKTIDITGFETKRPYTGKAVYQNPVLKDKTSESDAPLEKNVDYSITYVKNVNAGKATMTITGLGKYSGTIKKNFTIEKVALNGDMLQRKVITVKQNRAGATPDVELVYEGRTLIKDRDYKLTYTGNKNTTSETKQAWINIAGKGNFKGSLKKAVELKIEPKSWNSGEITVEVSDVKYNSKKAQYTPN
ncbi:MAG: glycoside hydrolase family 26 protein, partial [Lachnospiraceae bacterium]|nr:glycoside hydrolase family 26 protein [Lachnospiraceae bacterium]